MARTALLRRLTSLLRLAVAKEQGLISQAELDAAIAMRRDGATPDIIMTEISRRRFVGASTLGVAGLVGIASLGGSRLLTGCQTPTDGNAALSTVPTASKGRIAIIGGGTAGLTAAYRLYKAGIACEIYEGSQRVGGRMYTQNNFNSDGMFCERGGELIDTEHTDIISLCQELGLEVQELANDPAGTSVELFFAGGRQRGEAEILRAFGPLSKGLARDAALVSPSGELEVPTYNSSLAQSAAVQRLDQMTLTAYLEQFKTDKWLLDLIRIAYVGEYGLEADYQSALNLVLLIDPSTKDGVKLLGSSDESKRIAGGNESLPRKLAATIQKSVPIHMQHRLIAVLDQGTSFNLIFDQDGRTVEVSVDQVILALPITLLREVDLSKCQLSDVKKKAITEWGMGTNAKFMLGFKTRPWRSKTVPGGFVAYTDTSSQEFWDTSRGQKGASGIVTNFLGGDAGRLITPSLYAKTLANFDLVFNDASKVADGNKLLQHWPSQPFTKGSYTCSLPGQYTTIYGAPGEPELNGRLLFAGEHCSVDYSGYMNGAVQSGNAAAEALLAKAGVFKGG